MCITIRCWLSWIMGAKLYSGFYWHYIWILLSHHLCLYFPIAAAFIGKYFFKWCWWILFFISLMKYAVESSLTWSFFLFISPFIFFSRNFFLEYIKPTSFVQLAGWDRQNPEVVERFQRRNNILEKLSVVILAFGFPFPVWYFQLVSSGYHFIR